MSRFITLLGITRESGWQHKALRVSVGVKKIKLQSCQRLRQKLKSVSAVAYIHGLWAFLMLPRAGARGFTLSPLLAAKKPR